MRFGGAVEQQHFPAVRVVPGRRVEHSQIFPRVVRMRTENRISRITFKFHGRCLAQFPVRLAKPPLNQLAGGGQSTNPFVPQPAKKEPARDPKP